MINNILENRINQIYGERSLIATGIIKELKQRSNNKGGLKYSDIQQLVNVLNIPSEQAGKIFFQ